ncbi:DUF4421 family protein [Corallibacter vietnamensis]
MIFKTGRCSIKVIKSRWVLLMFLFLVAHAQSQTLESKDSLSLLQKIDRTFIDRDLSNYSLRVFTNYKAKVFKIKDDNSKSRYVPNNRYGIGLGFANSKMLIDLAFNIKSKKNNATRRFDLQGTTILGKHNYVNFYIQSYKGFLVKNDFGAPTVFSPDVKSLTIGFNYLYTLSEIEFSYALLKAGLAKKNKTVYFTGGLGTFAVFDYFSSDGNVIPESNYGFYNSQAQIKRYNSAAIGVLGGLLGVFILPKNIVLSCNVMPGIALMNKKVELQHDSYRPSNPMLYKFDFSLAVNYNIDRFYVNVSYGNGVYSTDLDFDNRYLFNLSNAKLAVGYRLKVKK